MNDTMRIARCALRAMVLSAFLLSALAGDSPAAPPMEVDAVKAAKALPASFQVVGVVAARNTSSRTFAAVS